LSNIISADSNSGFFWTQSLLFDGWDVVVNSDNGCVKKI